jgi:hypothetical protein
MRLAFSILDLAARLLFALGIGCLLLAGYLGWQSLSFAPDSVRTTGEVVSQQEVRSDDGVRYRPRVRFRTEDGSIVTITGQLATGSPRHAVGTQVPVVYAAAKPTEARLATFTDNWLGASIAAAVGLVGLVGGFLVRRSVGRELAKSRA